MTQKSATLMKKIMLKRHNEAEATASHVLMIKPIELRWKTLIVPEWAL